jgi:hypothetical protein
MRAPDKNRYLNAVRHIETAEIPFQEDEIETTVAGKMLGKKLPPVRPYELPTADYVEVNLRAGNDLVYLGHVWELGRKNYIDAEGRKHYVDGTMKTRDSLKDVWYPDLGEYERDIARLLAAMEGTGLGMKYSATQAPFLVTTAVGYQDYYLALYDDPQFIHDFQALLEEFCLRELEMALTYPIDVIQVSFIAFSKAGMMMSREHLEEFELPSLRRRVKMIRDAGKVVSLHADGNFSEMLPELIEMGIEVVNPVEPCEGEQDIYRLKAQYGGRMAFHGNIDLAGVLAYGTPEEVARDTVEHLERLSPGGGYVAASSHNITEAVPLENFYAMRDAVVAYRR